MALNHQSLLLQKPSFSPSLDCFRNVQIILEKYPNQNILDTILYPNASITELLLREGFARCVDWLIAVHTWGAKKLRAAEKFARNAG